MKSYGGSKVTTPSREGEWGRVHARARVICNTQIESGTENFVFTSQSLRNYFTRLMYTLVL